jgi:tetratricopeptide (TPR) repeat protein
VAVRVQVAKALNGAARVHRARGETDAELAVCGEVVRRFGHAAESPLRVQVARALMNQIVTERAVRKGNQSADRDAFFRRFVGASEAQIREWTADVLKDEAIARAEEGHWAAAVEASDRVLGHLRGAGDDVGRRAIAWALTVKGEALEELGRDAEAREAYGDVADRFREDEARELRALAAEADRQRRQLARPCGFRRPRQIGPLTIAPPWIETRIEGPLGHWPRFGWAIIAIAVAATALGLPGGRRLLSALEDYGTVAETRAHVVEHIGVVALAIGMGALAVCWLVQLGLVVLGGRRDHLVFVVLCPLVLGAYVAIVSLAGWPSLFLD